MIKLTRLDGHPFILNADLIRYVEQRPDTFVTLVSGERIVVNESMDHVVELAIDYQQRKAMLPSLLKSPNYLSAQDKSSRANNAATASTSKAMESE